VRDFPRPKPVKVKIFGDEHELHRLTRQDVWNLTETVAEQLQGVIEKMVGEGLPVSEAVKGALRGGGPALDLLLKTSFPTFREWNELPMKYELQLMDLVWEENDLAGIVEDFFALTEKVARSAKRISTLKSKG
jgi:hypothetical protein